LANALQPGSVKKVNKSAMAFKQMENISFFLSFAEKHITKSELFQTVDLFEGQDPNAVVICLASLARKAEELFGKPGLGPKVFTCNHYTVIMIKVLPLSIIKLRAGETIIGLQMGTNKGANASGINMGNTRHM
uniref:Calponin-homology (CH) domain-containing protein n=1 Tax=Gongylonema pulchrum TaxID=637853 RepID=A0A183DBH5_9BILA